MAAGPIPSRPPRLGPLSLFPCPISPHVIPAFVAGVIFLKHSFTSCTFSLEMHKRILSVLELDHGDGCVLL